MESMSKKMVGLLVLVAVVAAGCGSKSGDQATPKDTVRTMFNALKDGNKSAFVGCFKVEGDQKKFLGATFGMAHGMLRLKKAVEGKYGADGWAKFQAAGGGMQSSGFEDLSDEKLAKIEVKINGDKAVCTSPDEKEPMNMVKVGGKWLIDMGKQMPPAAEAGPAMKMMDAMKGAIDKVISQVGKPGQTPESLNKLLGAEMMKAMMSSGAMFEAPD